jgi:hypothetical protein
MWENYSVEHQDWINRSFEIDGRERPNSNSIPDEVYSVQGEGVYATAQPVNASGGELFAPVWQLSPPPVDPAIVNLDLLSFESSQEAIFSVSGTKSWAMSSSLNSALAGQNATEFGTELQSVVTSPIFENSTDNETSSEVVGILWSTLPWERYLDYDQYLLINGVLCVLRSPCLDEAFTYEIVQGTAGFVGSGDLHDTNYDYFEHTFVVNGNQSAPTINSTTSEGGICQYTFSVYPTDAYAGVFHSSSALTAAMWMALLFSLLVVSFCAYDYYYRQRSEKVIKIAVSRSQVLATLFPANVRERLYADIESEMAKEGNEVNYAEQLQGLLPGATAKGKSAEFETEGCDNDNDEDEIFRSRPIADFCKLIVSWMTICSFVPCSFCTTARSHRNDSSLCRHHRIHELVIRTPGFGSLPLAGDTLLVI